MAELYDPQNIIYQLRGPIADPALSMLLKKELLAQIKYRALEMEVHQLQRQMDLLKLQMDMLAKEYNIR